MKLELLPAYEGQSYPGHHTPFHFLHGAMTPGDLLAFLQAIFAYGSEDIPQSLAEAAPLLIDRESTVLGGGLLVRKGDYVIEPGCCCGLEGWREWYFVSQRKGSPWLGHDPFPAAEPREAGVLFHTDTDEGAEDETLLVSWPEFEAAFAAARQDLDAFAMCLRAWVASENIPDGDKLCDLICEWFRIGPEHA